MSKVVSDYLDGLFNSKDIVEVLNPTGEDYEFKYGGARYIVQSGETAPMAGYMARNYLKHLSTAMMIEDSKDKEVNDLNVRQGYIDRIFVGVRTKVVDQDTEEVSDEPIVLSKNDPGMLAPDKDFDSPDLPIDKLPPEDDGKGGITTSKVETAFPEVTGEQSATT